MPPDVTRRTVIAALASLPLGSAAASPSAPRAVAAPGSKVLVAYFSRSGNTRVIAGLLQRAFQADLFEIVPATAYPDEYLATVEEARQERDRDAARPLRATVAHLAPYDTVYLGFPIWGTTAPPVIKGFLKAHDLAGKQVVPFITHGGYGLGDSQAVLRRLAPQARFGSPFSMQADQERQTMERVNDWLTPQRSTTS
ncbi:Flavodoxin [Pseudoxanthomonas sp. GM95]|uniref:flavodoxin n=1 Tax=Pseudoxanthomonas sp. GM95 TaxID=1881043 RepID=UPI0008CD9EBA|nr:flavodoxin [Pseudoxanthomonas sp. GM95]SEK69243.1 Flavodoxin [Pseudoxanthomonas sp. GM95]